MTARLVQDVDADLRALPASCEALTRRGAVVFNQGVWSLVGKLDEPSMTPAERAQFLNAWGSRMQSGRCGHAHAKMTDAVKTRKRQLWWRTTTPVARAPADKGVFGIDEDGFIARQAEMAALLDSNWRVFDAHAPVALLVAGVQHGLHDAWVPVANRSQAVYVDSVHFHPYVYRGARTHLGPTELLAAALTRRRACRFERAVFAAADWGLVRPCIYIEQSAVGARR